MSKEDKFERMLGIRIASRRSAADDTPDAPSAEIKHEIAVSTTAGDDTSAGQLRPRRGRPTKADNDRKTPRVTRTLSLNSSVYCSLLEMAEKDRRTFNAFVNIILEDYVNEKAKRK